MRVLVEVTIRLPDQMMSTTLDAIRSLPTSQGNAFVIGINYTIEKAFWRLAPHLPSELMAPALPIAVRVGALSLLVPRLSPELIVSALRITLSRRDQASTLSILIPHLPTELLKSALESTQKLPEYDDENTGIAFLRRGSPRAGILKALAPRLSSELLGTALHAAYAIKDKEALADVLAALAGPLTDLTPVTLYSLWTETLRFFAMSNRRSELLAILAALAPVIVKLGGQEGVLKMAQAIINTSHWWP